MPLRGRRIPPLSNLDTDSEEKLIKQTGKCKFSCTLGKDTHLPSPGDPVDRP
jgi:hypothetical protein